MRMSPRFLFVVPCLVLVLAAGRPRTATHSAAQNQTAEKVSFCDLLARPAAYSGRMVVITVDIHMFKEGASLSSPECSKKAVWLLIESESGPGMPELSRWISPHRYYARHRLIATLTGTLDPHYYDKVTHRTRLVFKVVAAKDIKRSRNVEQR